MAGFQLGILPQVPTWASQLFRELAVEHENTRIFAILGCGAACIRLMVDTLQ